MLLSETQSLWFRLIIDVDDDNIVSVVGYQRKAKLYH